MTKYSKISTLWAREETKPHNMIVGKFEKPEFELLKDIQWNFTEKFDGTNIRVIWDGNKVSFKGKTDDAQISTKLYDKLNELFSGEANEQVFESKFGETPVTLYGEGYGGAIQGNRGYDYGDHNFVLFDVKIGDFWLERHNIEDIAKTLDIEVVPIVATGTLKEMSDMVAEGFNSVKGDFKSEGLVARPTTEIQNRKGERIITKLKHKDFIKLAKQNY